MVRGADPCAGDSRVIPRAAPGTRAALAPAHDRPKAAYTLANPVEAGLVQAGHLWPGLWSRPDAIGTTLRVKRPDHFFDADGLLPEHVDLELKVPAGFPSTQEFRVQLQAELSRQEQAAREVNSAFLGEARVRAQSPFARPRPGEPRRQLSPRVAARDRWKRIELLQRLKSFLADYAEALLVWREGKVDPVFPAGTYMMRVMHGATCAPA